MAKVHPFASPDKNSWLVTWVHTQQNKGSCTHIVDFNIPERNSSFVMVYRFKYPLDVTVTLEFFGVDEDRPIAVRIVGDGSRDMEQVDHETWKDSWTLSAYQPTGRVSLIVVFPPKENHLIKRMANLLDDGIGADVIFEIQGQEIPAHKAILSTASTVIDALFNSNEFKESSSGTLSIADADPQVFRHLLHYIYTGTVPLSESGLQMELLFLAAVKYELEDLQQACERTMIADLKPENVIRNLVFAHENFASNLLKSSLKYLADAQETVRKRPEWRKLLDSNKDLFYLASEKMFSRQLCSRCCKTVRGGERCHKRRKIA